MCCFCGFDCSVAGGVVAVVIVVIIVDIIIVVAFGDNVGAGIGVAICASSWGSMKVD